MKKIELVKGIHSSVLGFGCAPVLGSVDAASARRALHCALDQGINHFDLARSYGYGEAETFTGKILHDRRKDLVIASKFGIRANWKAKLMRPVKPLLRTLKQKRKSGPEKETGQNTGPSLADRFHDRLDINAKEMTGSLEKSLKALKTDYLDYFFIHEPHFSIAHIGEVMETAAKLKEQGKIRAFGLSFMRSQEHLHQDYIDQFDILQFDNSPGAPDYEKVKNTRENKPNIFFSPLRGGSREMKAGDKLLKLSNDFPSSVILCSMFKPEHIKSNCALFN
jgi:aryl-alcohol dehydrogenase-like predicted oxidoreductase